MARRNVYWVPTFTVDHSFPTEDADTPEFLKKTFALQKANFAKALQKGVKIALGSGLGRFRLEKIQSG